MVSLREVPPLARAALMNPCGVIQICVRRPSMADRKSRSGAAGTAEAPAMSHAKAPLITQIFRNPPARDVDAPASGGFLHNHRLQFRESGGVALCRTRQAPATGDPLPA